MVTPVSSPQFKNSLELTARRLSGSSTLVSAMSLSKALAPMAVTPSGTLSDVSA